MRETFLKAMSELAREDERVMLVIGDTGFSVVEPFEREFGERFVNAGIAEQNFISFSAGLAAMGMKPIVYNVVSFMALRAMEQIVLDICYQQNPVVLVGVGGGFAYGPAGPTHHALQDIAMMRALPGMTVYCPGDPQEMRAVMYAAAKLGTPAYIRIGRSVDPQVHLEPFPFETGKAIELKGGGEIAVFACGTILKEAALAVNLLGRRGINSALYSFPTIKPLDKQTVLSCAKNCKAIFTIEEHSVIGGLGSAVAEVLAQEAGGTPLKIYGVQDVFAALTGSREYQLRYHGLAPEAVADDIEQVWRTIK